MIVECCMCNAELVIEDICLCGDKCLVEVWPCEDCIEEVMERMIRAAEEA